MTEADTKKLIQSALQSFKDGDLTQKSIGLFQALGYNTDRQNFFSEKTYRFFRESFFNDDTRFSEEKALVPEWKYIDLLFQLSKDEITPQHSLFDTKKVDRTIIETYLFFVIGLSKDNYNRTALSQITREINKVFPMPVMVLFKYGSSLTLAVINRRLHKRDERKDVLEKVTLIKDISIENPHRAHIEILFDLSFSELLRVHKFCNFIELHNTWQKTLDTKELNKRFYQELANWYFWAMDHVSFPDDIEKNKDIRNATSLIRLITRIIFIWFIKEKNLVPEILFDRKELGRILKEFTKNEKSNSYYNAILQNLFFGTLNQKMNERAFVKEGDFYENREEYGVKNLFRYADLFSISKDKALALFKDIPFLNGGLFDCLDKPDEEGKILNVDGFSRDQKKQAFVPDYLFFGSEVDYDLNAIYGTKNKLYKVKSLIDILSSYKFTVAENTPIEEEVALDPELLGKVFENLLASYNPETQTTVRKQTGSFYTPREIVNYMVDESLKAYLKQALAEKLNIKAEDAEAGLDILFSYTEKEHAFTEEETTALIQAIDSCKILDPACGSGAFLMGILHKLVFILHKLDLNNEKWSEIQRQKAIRDTEEAFKIGGKKEREERLLEINDIFENNSDDYGRKLYLIENCIYGVDIQPIAVQIAKLRFFISLVVDENKQPGKENLGIRSLPNLETKFVAANTLIGLEKPETQTNLFENKEISSLEEKLEELRHRYFSAKIRKEKMACQKEDKTLRQKIAKLLEKDGWEHITAEQIVAFDPYDQNASSPFFDAEWMFGIKDGFDVVIGNPPYVSTRTKDFDLSQKNYFKINYTLAIGQYDLFTLFIERSNSLICDTGVLSFITPKRLLTNENFEGARKLLLKQLPIINYVDAQMPFEAASVEANVIISTRIKTNKVKTFLFNGTEIEFRFIVDYSLIQLMPFNIFPFAINPNNVRIINLILKKSKENFGNSLNIIRGMECGFNHPSISNSISKFKIIKGEHIAKYFIRETDFYVKPNFSEIKVFKSKDIYLKTPKLLTKFVSNSIDIAYDDVGYFNTNVVYNIHPKQNKEKFLKYFMVLGNSRLINFWFFNTYGNDDKLFPHIQKNQLDSIPVLFPKNISIYILLSDYILFLKQKMKNSSFHERLIDAMVYELYFPDEIKAADAVVLKHLTNLPELKDDWSDEQKLSIIEKAYKELFDPAHPVSVAMEKMKTVPEVRIIEGLDK